MSEKIPPPPQYGWTGYAPEVAKELQDRLDYLHGLSAWSLFLYARTRVIEAMRIEGKSDLEIFNAINVEPMQLQGIEYGIAWKKESNTGTAITPRQTAVGLV